MRGEKYQIVDIGLRMLTPRELFDAQGFPENYIIDVDVDEVVVEEYIRGREFSVAVVDGKAYPKAEQVARCGNAVCPPIPAALVRANLPELCGDEKTEAAQ